MTDAPKLLLCPFCGKPDPYTDHASCEKFGYRTGHNWAVACSWCEVSAPGAASIDEAIAAWNTRPAATLTALQARVAELEEAAQQMLIEYDDVDLDKPEPASMTAAVYHLRAAIDQMKRP